MIIRLSSVEYDSVIISIAPFKKERFKFKKEVHVSRNIE